ncbi:hypothetical protein CMV_025017 [Castanea mollissima]|uniref:TIR domain-containing protein n=1 Tax=Castanea mollissima TaxID=60419 RepID=A0A8J4QDA5_9ROSI|nr:hypothetical protein CMV_025017 [Castanea mollissima]
MEVVETWRAALREVANLSGWHLQDRQESIFIQHIVEDLVHVLTRGTATEAIQAIPHQVSLARSKEFGQVKMHRSQTF